MPKTYYLDLSRNDSAQASRLTGAELDRTPDAEWLETYFIPAVSVLTTAGKTGKPVQGPLTFWVKVSAASFPEPRREIFICSTPWNVSNPVIKALRPLAHSDICEGTMYLPGDAFPCCQIFQGKLIRFYRRDEDGELETPGIYWAEEEPILAWIQIKAPLIAAENSKGTDPVWVRAEVVGEGRRKDGWPGEGPTGDYCRSVQRRLPGMAKAEEAGCSGR